MGETTFRERYGPWALIAGASEGLGAAFAEALASRGVHIYLIARRAELLASTAECLRTSHAIEVETFAMDLSSERCAEHLRTLLETRDFGLGVYNAAYSPIGPFLERPLDDLIRAVDVNVRGPLLLARQLGPHLVERGRGGIVLMSSLAGNQGSPRIATYAATKAFNTILGEGLGHELRAHGVDVLVSVAGAIRTPGYEGAASGDAPGTLDAEVVAEKTLRALGRSTRITPGFVNGLASFVLGRLMTRAGAVSTMASSTKDLQ